MPEQNKTIHNETGDKGRLREIFTVLANHEVIKGISPEKLCAVLEDLGPTFIKLGQILSMRPDLLPPDFCRELARLRVDVNPMTFTEVKKAIESEYGRSFTELFSSFDETPLGSASIAQVHTARLPDGSRVAVKVQRPEIRETMARDISLLRKAAGVLKLTQMGGLVDFNLLLDEMWAAAKQETDFLIEAQNAEEFRKRNEGIAYAGCPKIFQRFTTSKVLVMEYIDGIAVDDTTQLLAEGYDLEEIGLKLADHYVKQVVDDGFFHADPHPGNLRIREGKIIWLDLGLMGRLTAHDRELLRDAVKAVVRKDIDTLQKRTLELCEPSGAVDQESLRGDIEAFLEKYGERELGSIHLGLLLEEILEILKKHRLSMPDGVFLLGRGLVSLEGVLSEVSPEINLLQIMANRMSSSLLRDFDWQKELKSAALWLYQSGRKAADAPANFSDLLRMGAKGQAKLNVNLTGAQQRLSFVNKMVNKAVQALLAAALFLGSCILCGLPIQPRLWGIPLWGLIGILAALLLGIRLLWKMRKEP